MLLLNLSHFLTIGSLLGGIEGRLSIFNLFSSSMGDAQSPMSPSNTNSGPTLSDVLPVTRRINIFESLVRDHPRLPARLGDKQKSLQETNFTVLAPLNSAMQALERKPWEDSSDYVALGQEAYAGSSGEERAQKNLERFVEAHMVPISPWAQGEEGKTKTMADSPVWWEERGDHKGRVIMPLKVEVEEVASQVGNGEVWVLRGVLQE